MCQSYTIISRVGANKKNSLSEVFFNGARTPFQMIKYHLEWRDGVYLGH